MKHLITLLLLITFSVSGLAQDRVLRPESKVKEDGNNVVIPSNIKYGNSFRGTYPNGVVIPGADNFFDYVTNGKNMSNMWVFGDTLIVAYFGADSTDPTGATSRVAFYIVSEDGGSTWGSPNAMTTLPVRSAYPDLDPYIGGTGRNVALSGRYYAPAGSRGGAFTDAFFNLGSITATYVPNDGTDFFSHFLNGNFIGGISSITDGGSSDTLNFWKFDVSGNSFSSPFVIVAPGADIGDNVRYHCVADESGNNIFALWWNDGSVTTDQLNYRMSSDGGSTWGAISHIMDLAGGINNMIGGDSVIPYVSNEVVFKPGTSDPYVAVTTLAPGSFSVNTSTKIALWSPGLNGGNLVEVAGSSNMTIMSDTGLYNSIVDLQVGVVPVSHPSLGWSADGSRLVCTFSAYQPGDTLDLFNFNDIYATYSDDNGATWSIPENITNTSDWDELYPTVAPSGNSVTKFSIHYQATRGPGSQSFTDNAPVYRVHEIYDTYEPPVSIQNISSEIPDGFSLKQNYPNPFNPSTSIRFDIAKTSKVTLKVYDATGREVATLLNNQEITPGTFEYNFNAESLSSGIYFYTLQSDNFRETKKMMLLK